MSVGDERNVELKNDYEKEADTRIKSMIQADGLYGPQVIEGSIIDLNPQIGGQ